MRGKISAGGRKRDTSGTIEQRDLEIIREITRDTPRVFGKAERRRISAAEVVADIREHEERSESRRASQCEFRKAEQARIEIRPQRARRIPQRGVSRDHHAVTE